MTGIRRKQFKQALLDASSSQSDDWFKRTPSRFEMRVYGDSSSEGMKVAMKARTRQQEFS